MPVTIRRRGLACLLVGALIALAGLVGGAPAQAAAGPTLVFRGTFGFEVRAGSGLDALSTSAVFPQPGPASVVARNVSFGKQWNMFIVSTGGGVLLKSTTAGLCLDGNSTADGATVTANACDDVAPFDTSQLWIISSVPGNPAYMRMQNTLNGRYLTAVGTSRVELRGWSSAVNQQWRMTQVCC
jgi:hypothetical protein